MALADTIRASVTTAKSLLNSGRLMVTVYQYPWASQNQYGEPTFGARVARKAIVSPTEAQPNQDETAKIKLTFLENFDIDPRDRFEYPYPTKNEWMTSGIVRLHRGVLDADRAAFVIDVFV